MKTVTTTIMLALSSAVVAGPSQTWESHPPIRPVLPASQRPLAKGPTYFVHPMTGDDTNPGTEQKPWKTIGHALLQLKAGDTLCLRGGNYFEQLRVSLTGKPDAPITIRGYPGEYAIINGGLREFVESPQQAWEAVPGLAGEYRSARAYPNIRDVIGAFGDSFVGLHTYWHRIDLTATNELWTAEGKEDVAPVYCGPGILYDRGTSRIHVRLAHTHFDWPGVPNYQGETDPRKLPLVIGPFASTPLHVDGAQHVRFQDLTICGGGYETVVIDQGRGIEFDNVTVHCGTYGLIARNMIGFRFHNSALYGNIPPWGSRVENSLRNRSGRDGRDVARLTGHALLVASGNDEFSIYAFPFNRDWEISNSEFTDSHDGLYLGGVENMKFHHNLLDNCHDDGIYLSQVYPYAPQSMYLYQNKISRCLTSLAFGGVHAPPYGDSHPPRGPVYVYRNVFDLSGSVNYTRPSTKEPSPKPSYGGLLGDHGSPPWATMYIYQNTVIQSGERNRYTAIAATSKERPRKVFNNIFYYFNTTQIPNLTPAPSVENDLETDGNLFWLQGAESPAKIDFLANFRTSKVFEESKAKHAPGWEAHSVVADPLLMKIEISDPARNDYHLGEGSAAIGKGVALPAELEDPLRAADGKSPDIGALPHGAEKFEAGRIRK